MMSRNRRAGRWRWALAVITVIGAVLAGISLQVRGAGPAGAAINDYTTGTYNMQGSAGGVGGGVNKWSSDVRALLGHGIQVLALQEAGAPPGGAQMAEPQTVIVNTPDGGEQHFTFQQGTWQPGGSRGPVYYIYWLQTDPTANRVNLAMVTTQRASGLRFAYGGAGGNGRPALGVRFGNEIFWTVHALSAGGNNAGALVQNIADASSPLDWAAMGDWNRTPTSLASQLTANNFGTPVYYYRTLEATQQSGNELDYMVSSEDIAGYGAARMPIMGSDHYPVLFTQLRAGAGTSLGLFNAGDEAYLGLASATPQNGTGITVNNATQDTYAGSWYLDPDGTNDSGTPAYRIRNITTNECLDLPNNTVVATEEPCDTSNGQRFTLTFDNNDATHLIIRSTVPETTPIPGQSPLACVTGPPRGSDPPHSVILGPCGTQTAFWNWHYDRDPPPNAPMVAFGP